MNCKKESFQHEILGAVIGMMLLVGTVPADAKGPPDPYLSKCSNVPLIEPDIGSPEACGNDMVESLCYAIDGALYYSKNSDKDRLALITKVISLADKINLGKFDDAVYKIEEIQSKVLSFDIDDSLIPPKKAKMNSVSIDNIWYAAEDVLNCIFPPETLTEATTTEATTTEATTTEATTTEATTTEATTTEATTTEATTTEATTTEATTTEATTTEATTTEATTTEATTTEATTTEVAVEEPVTTL